LHGCTIARNSLIGMGAVVLNGARIGKNCLVGAGAVVTEGKEFPDNSLIVGTPARALRTLDEKAAQAITCDADIYVRRWQQYAKGLTRIGGETSAAEPRLVCARLPSEKIRPAPGAEPAAGKPVWFACVIFSAIASMVLTGSAARFDSGSPRFCSRASDSARPGSKDRTKRRAPPTKNSVAKNSDCRYGERGPASLAVCFWRPAIPRPGPPFLASSLSISTPVEGCATGSAVHR